MEKYREILIDDNKSWRKLWKIFLNNCISGKVADSQPGTLSKK